MARNVLLADLWATCFLAKVFPQSPTENRKKLQPSQSRVWKSSQSFFPSTHWFQPHVPVWHWMGCPMKEDRSLGVNSSPANFVTRVCPFQDILIPRTSWGLPHKIPAFMAASCPAAGDTPPKGKWYGEGIGERSIPVLGAAGERGAGEKRNFLSHYQACI